MQTVRTAEMLIMPAKVPYGLHHGGKSIKCCW